jgi:hypothetical protein
VGVGVGVGFGVGVGVAVGVGEGVGVGVGLGVPASSVPMPLRLTMKSGSSGSSLEIMSVAAREPVVEGIKVSCTCVLLPGVIVVLGELAMANSVGFAPPKERLMCRSPIPVFEIVVVIAALVVPIGWLPNTRLARLTFMFGRPGVGVGVGAGVTVAVAVGVPVGLAVGVGVGVGVGVDSFCTSNAPMSITLPATLGKPGPR